MGRRCPLPRWLCALPACAVLRFLARQTCPASTRCSQTWAKRAVRWSWQAFPSLERGASSPSLGRRARLGARTSAGLSPAKAVAAFAACLLPRVVVFLLTFFVRPPPCILQQLQSEDEEEDDTELFDAREMLTPPQNEPSHVTDVIDAMAASISNHSPAMLAAPPNSMEASAADGNLGSGVAPVPPAKVTAKDFDILSVIGQGGYGKVGSARAKHSRRQRGVRVTARRVLPSSYSKHRAARARSGRLMPPCARPCRCSWSAKTKGRTRTSSTP